MSRRKARLISCNDKRYVQYYNLYRNKSIILNPYLNKIQTNINTKEQHFKSQKNSEKYKIIIKGLVNRNSKKYAIVFVIILYLSILLTSLIKNVNIVYATDMSSHINILKSVYHAKIKINCGHPGLYIPLNGNNIMLSLTHNNS